MPKQDANQQNVKKSNTKTHKKFILNELYKELLIFLIPSLAICYFILMLPTYKFYMKIISSFDMTVTSIILYCAHVFIVLILAQLSYNIYKRHVIDNRHYTENDKFKQIADTLKSLDHASSKYNTIGMIAAQVALVSVLVFGAVVFNLFQSTEKLLVKLDSNKYISETDRKGMKADSDVEVNNNSKNNDKTTKITNEKEKTGNRNKESSESWLVIIIIILRTSLLGSFIVTVIIQTLKFVASSFDQAVRFKKRKHATLFLLQLMEHGDTREGIADIMNAFKEWNTNVESAYTPNKFADKNKPEKIDKSEEYYKEILAEVKKMKP